MKSQVKEVAAKAEGAAPPFPLFRAGAAALAGAGASIALMWFKANPFRPWFIVRDTPCDPPVAPEQTDDRVIKSLRVPVALPPGSYTRQTLPPPRPEVAKILDEVRSEAAALRARTSKAAEKSRRIGEGPAHAIVPTDPGKTVIRPTDKGKRGKRSIRIT